MISSDQAMSAAAPPTARPVRGQRIRSLLANRQAIIGILILLFFLVMTLLAPVLAPGDPNAIIDLPHLPPSPDHILGTTGQGQDVFAQLVWGARKSLGLGGLVGVAATTFGAVVGLSAAYFGGRVDNLLTLLTNIFLIIPGLPLLVVLAAFLPPGPSTVVFVLSITGWAWTARVMRAQALSLREQDFVSAALVGGENSPRIMFAEILPNMASIVGGALVGGIIYGITAQAGLEFLGLGDLSAVSWGTILYWAGTNASLMRGAWWVFVPTGLCIALVAFALAMLNYAVDAVTNPRLRAQSALKNRSVVNVLRPRPQEPNLPSTSGSEPLLDIRDLYVQYHTGRGPVRAVDGVSFAIAPGEVFGIAGESGSGKSTIAHAIMRLLRPPAVIAGGQIVFRGRDVLTMRQRELEQFRWSQVSMVFQSAMNALNPVMTIGDQLTDVVRVHTGMSKQQATERAVELMRLVGIESSRLNAYPHQLSGGMRQRAVIAIALALKPPLIIMDEPTTALDVVVQKDILQQIDQLKAQLGFSILFITHDLSLLVEFATRIAIMYAGEIVELAPARELFDNPLHPYTQGLMNSFPTITGQKKKMAGIPGAPPDMVVPPSGCRFHPRCPLVQPMHTQVVPRLREITPGHAVACHLFKP